MSSDLWIIASGDAEDARDDRLVTSIRVKAASYWSVLASAQTEDDFSNRLALIAPKLDAIVASVVGDDPMLFVSMRGNLEEFFIQNFVAQREAARRTATQSVVAGLEQFIQKNAASMTRQHFQHIADSIASAPVDDDTRGKLAEHFANRLGSTNGMFDRGRFIKACSPKTATKKRGPAPSGLEWGEAPDCKECHLENGYHAVGCSLNPKTHPKTAGAYGDTGPHQQDWADTRQKIMDQADKCRYCKSKRTRSGKTDDMCSHHRDTMRNSYATHPASENYWTSSKTAGSMDPIAYTYEADIHCPGCTEARFGRGADGFIGSDSTDSEGNPVGAVAPWDEMNPAGEVCGTCGGPISEPYADPDGVFGSRRTASVASQIEELVWNVGPTNGYTNDDERKAIVDAEAAAIPADLMAQVTPADLEELTDDNFHTTVEVILAARPDLKWGDGGWTSTASRHVAWDGVGGSDSPRTGPCKTCGAQCNLSGTGECPSCVGKSIHDTLHPRCRWTTPNHHHAEGTGAADLWDQAYYAALERGLSDDEAMDAADSAVQAHGAGADQGDRVELWNEQGGVDGDPATDPPYIDTEGSLHTASGADCDGSGSWVVGDFSPAGGIWGNFADARAICPVCGKDCPVSPSDHPILGETGGWLSTHLAPGKTLQDRASSIRTGAKTRVAGEGAYATDAHDSSIRKDVPAGTTATSAQGYQTFVGTTVYDWHVDGLDGDGWQLGGDWSDQTTASRRTASLDDEMDFDHVVEVKPDGSVVDGPSGLYAPELYDGELQGGDWTLLDGFSGQSGYSGPLMHQSEFIGGGLEQYILSHPGYYVNLVNESYDDEEPTEWAVAYKPAPTTASRHTADASWDTGEVSLHFANDYDLYQQVQNSISQGLPVTADDARNLWGDADTSPNASVDVGKVDWQAVADEINADAAEVAEYDATQTTASRQTFQTAEYMQVRAALSPENQQMLDSLDPVRAEEVVARLVQK